MRKRGYNIVLAALFFTILAVVPAIAFSKENNKIPARAPDTNGAYSTASVEKLNGNKNNLNVSVFAGGMVFSEKFSINNNSAGTFAVGEYLVYVATYGNTKIEHCFIVSVPLSVAEHKCSFVEVGRAEPTCVADGVIAYECDCGETYKEILPATGHDFIEIDTAEATCTQSRKIIRECTECGEIEVEEIGEPLGHWIVAGVTPSFNGRFLNNGLSGVNNRRYWLNEDIKITIVLERGQEISVEEFYLEADFGVVMNDIYDSGDKLENDSRAFTCEIGCGTVTVTVTVNLTGNNVNTLRLEVGTGNRGITADFDFKITCLE